MQLIYTVLSFIVAIIVLVTVHEFGHFYVARRCGVRVLRFSLGFGAVLWRGYDRLGTEYTLCALPFGGYVKMLDEREAEVPVELQSQAFNRKTVWQRIAIVLAGPIANFILAFFLFWALLLQGEHGLVPIIGVIKPDSIAANAGLEVGQEIVAIDGIDTPTEQKVQKQLMGRLGESGQITFSVRYPNSSLRYELQASLNKWMQGVKDPDPLEGLGIQIPPIKPIVGDLLAKGPAEKAGFKVGDTIIRVNEQPIADFRDFHSIVRPNAGKPLHVTLARKSAGGTEEIISLDVVPESFIDHGVSYGRVGMSPQKLSDELVVQYDYSVGEALLASVNKTWETAEFVLLSVKKLILGEISTKNLSGPISIAKVAGSSAQQGLKSFVAFVALLSVFLGVFNLLPIPVLDGGHLVYLTVEAIRGKPVSEQVQILASQIGFMVVIGLSILAMYNDIMRL